MQINCPNCSTQITAENINIQKMVAVCPACNMLFPFDLPDEKAKRRKVKQPQKLTLRDAEHLHIEFWTNFRLDRSEAVFSSLFGGLGMLLVALLTMGAEDVPRLLPLGFLVVSLVFFYSLVLTVINKTHIEMDEDKIKVSRKPFPNPLSSSQEISLFGVVAIQYEETAASKKEGYDTPRYRVWAETEDGSRRTIVNDVTEEYAVFIAQRLEERLHSQDEWDTSRLEETEIAHSSDAEIATDEEVQKSRNNARR